MICRPFQVSGLAIRLKFTEVAEVWMYRGVFDGDSVSIAWRKGR